MITPSFEIKQDHHFLYITIKAPYSKVSEVDIFIDGEDFKFFAKPYFLRLSLPGSLIEDERANTKYDAENGDYLIKIAKEVPGTHFEDLDMLTKLLATPGERQLKQPLIEVVGDGDNEGSGSSSDEEFDWLFPQSVEPAIYSTSLGDGYGFANLKRDIFGKLQDDLKDIIQMQNLENSSFPERLQSKILFENDKFDPDHYLADYFENEAVERILALKPPWRQEEPCDDLSDENKFILKNLPNKEYLLNSSELQCVYLGLVDILFGYAYNWRCTEGEYCVESSWNIRTVSALLSWCVKLSTVPETIISSFRRVMTFPLYRSWKLAKSCQKDVLYILSSGRKYILKCLLDILDMFSKNDPYYILNDLYIKDYCVWIQKASDRSLESLLKSVKDFKICKKDVDFDLPELEEAAHLVLCEENTEVTNSCVNGEESITAKIGELKL